MLKNLAILMPPIFVAGCAAVTPEKVTAITEPLSPYAQSPSYQTTLLALAAEVPSPVRAAGGGEIFRNPRTQPEVRIVQKEGVKFYDTDSWTLNQSATGFEVANKATGVQWKFTAAAKEVEKVSAQVIRVRCSQTEAALFTLAAQGPFFGGGERFESATLDGRKWSMVPRDGIYGKISKQWTYAPMAWFFNATAGLGVYVDSASGCDLDFTTAGNVTVALPGKTNTPKLVDCYLIVGKTPKDVMRGFTSITGRTPMPPAWGLGVWPNLLRGRQEVLESAKRYRDLGIPASAIWIFDCMEPYKPHNPQVGWWLWTKGVYGDVPSLNAELHGLGFKSMGYVKQSGKTTDFRNPDAVTQWEKLLTDLLTRDGWDGWMEDFGEVSATYPMEYHKASHLIATRIKADKVAFCRSGSAGSQAYTQVLWAGDNPCVWNTWTEKGMGGPSNNAGIVELLPAMYSAGFSGFSVWAPDFLCETTDRELWKRWLQIAATSCVLRDHLWEYKPQNLRPFTDADTIATYKHYARLHNSLNPYLMALAREANLTGCPVLRHPLLECPNEPEAVATRTEFFIGDRLFIAPVLTKGAVTRQLYLPKGEWINWWTGAKFQGGQSVTVPAPLDIIPIFVRAGSVLPLVPDDVETLNEDLANGKWKTPGNRLVLKVFPASGNAQSSITLADGSTVTVATQDGEVTVTTANTSKPKEYIIILPNGKTEIVPGTDIKGKFKLK